MANIERDYLENEFDKPIVLVTYDGNLIVKEKIQVLRYDHKVDGQKATSKLNVLFAFPFEDYENIKTGIKLNKKIEAQKLKLIEKRSERSTVATPEEYLNGVAKNVKITMRTGHVLSGRQLSASQYDLLLQISEKIVLVYKHGILEYEIIDLATPDEK